MKKITAILSAAAMTLSALTVSAQEADYAEVLEKGIFKDSVNYVQNIDFLKCHLYVLLHKQNYFVFVPNLVI